MAYKYGNKEWLNHSQPVQTFSVVSNDSSLEGGLRLDVKMPMYRIRADGIFAILLFQMRFLSIISGRNFIWI